MLGGSHCLTAATVDAGVQGRIKYTVKDLSGTGGLIKHNPLYRFV